MKTIIFTGVLSVLLLSGLSSCKRDNNSNNNNNPNPGGEVIIEAKDLIVPAKFNFETEKELTIRVAVTNPSFAGERFVIKIYSEVPSTGAVIATGITSATSYEYSTKIRVPAYEEYIYIEKIDADGSSRYEKVKANKFVAATFTGDPNDGKYTFQKSGSGMNCSSGCTSTTNNLSGSSSISSGQTKCYTGTLSNATISVGNGGIAKICGSGTISSITVAGTGKVYILEGAALTITSYTANSSSNIFKSWSDSVIFSGSVSITGEFHNYGRLYVGGAFSANSQSKVKNYGLFNISGSGSFLDYVYNYDLLKVGGAMTVSSTAELFNYCHLNVTGDFTNSNGDIYNSSLIKVGGTFIENSNGTHEMDNGAVLSVKNITINGNIEGIGTNRSKIKVTTTSTINSNGDVDGKIDYCDSNGIETLNGGINSPAAQSCTGYIAPSTCNPEGFGQPAIQDADSDGVADAQDEYPNDATRAFNSFYPSATTTATLAFEDLWPATGDYDYNDLILAYNIQKVLNADNKVVDYKIKMKVRAIGASYDNGFGFQLDELVPSDVASVTGQVLVRSYITRNANNTEAGQSKAVIICYDSPEPSLQRPSGSMFNTIQANPTGTSDTIRVNINFSSPVVDSKLEIGDFNPFIMTNKRRGYEVHLGNMRPTDLATTSLFGTVQDRTNVSGNIFYKTANGMPWAISLPVDFTYPVERTSVTTAYNYFDDWAVSGGTTHTDWYTENPGNRNTSSLYTPN
ncbi:MAG: LruC domain-containing protein [Bacteroidetes bacterium]|nr:MAG: LruC domain-containing protein [Bacteroidota bacterium]